MGYAIVLAQCALCHKMFGFNPHRVPSVIIKDKREPVCKECHTTANQLRVAAGVPPWPEPHSDAYDPIPEEEL